MLLSRDQALDLARRVLVRSRAEACEVWLDGRAGRNFRIASRGGATNGASSGARVVVTAHLGRRRGRALTNDFDDAALADVVTRAEAAARLAPENPEAVPPLGPLAYPQSAAHAETTARLTVPGLADLVAPAVAVARAAPVDTALFAEATEAWRAYATSAGAAAYDRATAVNLTMTARNRRGTWSGWSGVGENDAARIDAAGFARAAIDKARAELDPVALDPGKYVVLLEPAVVAQFLINLMWRFDARQADEGRSFLSKPGGNKLGERLFDERITVTSNPADTVAPGYALSDDGQPNLPTTWIEGGVIKNLACSRFWAAKTNAPAVPSPGFCAMRGGTDAVDAMIRDVRRGVLVTRLWYVRTVDRRTVLLTGLTRDGNFLIENGRVTRPVTNFRFNESPLAVFSKVLGIGPARRARPSEVGGTISAPPLLVEDFTFSSISPAI
ncbi:MAG: TldD/PmbA family protein [Alphaproteobacteria bacterium]|nr:TldD/PmbA family protein [Alphaproteobacteria bacterium]